MNPTAKKLFLLRLTLAIGYLHAHYKIFLSALDKPYAKDFLQDYLLASAWRAGVDPYQTIDLLTSQLIPGAKGNYGYYFPHPTPHPPTMAVLFFPFTFFSYEVASRIFFGLELVSMYLSFYLLAQLMGEKVPAEIKYTLGLVFMSSYAVGQEFQQGNINLLQLLVLLVFVHTFQRYPLIAGSCLGYTLALKVGGVLLVPYLIIRRKWRVLIAAAGFCAASLLIFLAKSDFNTVLNYVFVHLPEVTRLYAKFYVNLSLWSIPEKMVHGVLPLPFFVSMVAPPLLPDPTLLPWLKLLLVGGGFLLMYSTAVLVRDDRLGIGIILAGTVVLTPSAWPHLLIIFAIPSAILIAARVERLNSHASFILPGLLCFGAAYGVTLAWVISTPKVWFVLPVVDSFIYGRLDFSVLAPMDPINLLIVSLLPTVLVFAYILALYRERA